MFKKCKLKWLAIRIELHWFAIKRHRRKGTKMIDNGVPLSTPKLFILGKNISKHGEKVIAMQKQYQDLCDITDIPGHSVSGLL